MQIRPKDCRFLRSFPGGPNFRFPVENKSIGFTYIRKNASTALKAYTLRNDLKIKMPIVKSKIAIMNLKYKISANHKFENLDIRFFIYRDPVSRFFSHFIGDICRNYNYKYIKHINRVTGENYKDINLQQFVFKYLKLQKWKHVNLHLLPQYLHLSPVNYTDCIEINDLKTKIGQFIDKDDLQKYFLNKKNMRSDISIIEYKFNEYTNISEIKSFYDEHKLMPSRNNFCSSEILSGLRDIYEMDYQMIDRISDI